MIFVTKKRYKEKISYDFQAPLGEFGLEGSMYRNLRLIHSFLADWQDRLAPMETVLPADWEKMTPDNHDDLRYAIRTKDGSGFLFLVNFQDHDNGRHDQKGTVEIKLSPSLSGEGRGEAENIKIPVTLPKDESMILPFNLDMDGNLLKYATAQPLMKINDKEKPHYFFFAPEGMQPEFVFQGGKTFRPKAGLKSTFTYKNIKVTCLTRAQALNASKVNGKLLITDATVLPTSSSATLLSLGKNTVSYIAYPSKAGFKPQTASVAKVEPQFTYDQRLTRRLSVHFNQDSVKVIPSSLNREDRGGSPSVQEYFLKIDYIADVIMAFMDGQLCQDDFYYGKPWIIGLKRYKEKMKKQDMGFYLRPLKDMEFLHRDLPKEAIPDFSNGPVLKVNKVEIIPEYKIDIRL